MNLSYSNTSKPEMASCALMESPSNQVYPEFTNLVHSINEGASQNLIHRSPTQVCDTIDPYQVDWISLYGSDPHESNDESRVNYDFDRMGFLYSPSNDTLEKPIHQSENTQPFNRNINNGWWDKATIRRSWTYGEDQLLVHLVMLHGEKNWARIAEKLPLRVGKQCRERWQNHLKPNVMRKSWSKEEDKLLIALHKQFGNKWTEIATRLPGRSENSVKNHFNATKRKRVSSKSWKHPSLLKDYITSITSASSSSSSSTSTSTASDDRVNIIQTPESSTLDPQNQHPIMSFSADVNAPSSGSGLGFNSDELVLEKCDFDYDQVSSHLVDQLEFDPKQEMDFLAVLGFGFQ